MIVCHNLRTIKRTDFVHLNNLGHSDIDQRMDFIWIYMNEWFTLDMIRFYKSHVYILISDPLFVYDAYQHNRTTNKFWEFRHPRWPQGRSEGGFSLIKYVIGPSSSGGNLGFIIRSFAGLELWLWLIKGTTPRKNWINPNFAFNRSGSFSVCCY